MPILKINQIAQGYYRGIWKIEEPLSHLEAGCSTILTTEYKRISVKSRKKQWLACRLLTVRLCQLLGLNFYGVKKGKLNKPFLLNSSLHLSFSHTEKHAAVLLHKANPCGIDIEKIHPRLARVQHKFMDPNEILFVDNNLEKICIFWCAKEAIYKWYGRKYLSFKNQIKLDMLDDGMLWAKIITDKHVISKRLTVEKHSDYLLVYVC